MHGRSSISSCCLKITDFVNKPVQADKETAVGGLSTQSAYISLRRRLRVIGADLGKYWGSVHSYTFSSLSFHPSFLLPSCPLFLPSPTIPPLPCFRPLLPSPSLPSSHLSSCKLPQRGLGQSPSLKIWHVVATVLITRPRINWLNFSLCPFLYLPRVFVLVRPLPRLTTFAFAELLFLFACDSLNFYSRIKAVTWCFLLRFCT